MTLALFITHHFLLPLSIYYVLNGLSFGWNNMRTLAIMCGAFLIDVDHLLADPIFDSARCSIGFHPLHRLPLIAIVLLIPVVLRVWPLVIGLAVHFLLDGIDCL